MKNTILNIFRLYLQMKINSDVMYSLLSSIEESEKSNLMIRFQKGDTILWTIDEIANTIWAHHKGNKELLNESMQAALNNPDNFEVL
jgi:predicted nucleic acid-binding protein